jgi:hypothetical protein
MSKKTFTVTHPDGTMSKRTSQSREYAYAIVAEPAPPEARAAAHERQAAGRDGWKRPPRLARPACATGAWAAPAVPRTSTATRSTCWAPRSPTRAAEGAAPTARSASAPTWTARSSCTATPMDCR